MEGVGKVSSSRRNMSEATQWVSEQKHGLVWDRTGFKGEWALVLREHACRSDVCFNHSSFLLEFGSYKFGSTKKTSTGNSFLFPQTKYKMEAVAFHVCMYMCIHVFHFYSPFFHKKVKSLYDLFSTVKEVASEKCMTSALSIRNCQENSWEEPLTFLDLGFLIFKMG